MSVYMFARAEIWAQISAPLAPLANSGMASILTVHEDETARERTGIPPRHAKAKKMKLLTLHTHGYLR